MINNNSNDDWDRQCAFPWNENGDSPGLTKREYFAGKAMQGLLAAPDTEPPDEGNFATSITNSAVIYADALIKQLNKGEIK